MSRSLWKTLLALAALVAVFIGTVIGLVSGFYRGVVDTALSRLIDVVLAFPILLLGLGLAAACSGADGCLGGLIQPGLPVVIMVIAIINWTYIARIVRGQVLSLREKTSRPSRSTPNGCSADGPVGVPKTSSACELCVRGPGVPASHTIAGARKAIAMRIAMKTSAVMAILSRRSRRQKSCIGERAVIGAATPLSSMTIA